MAFGEHLRDGRMSHLEALAFVYICSQADTRTGIWKGCAKSLAGELWMKERTARDVLEKIEQGAYIRRFVIPGQYRFRLHEPNRPGYPKNPRQEVLSLTDGSRTWEQITAERDRKLAAARQEAFVLTP